MSDSPILQILVHRIFNHVFLSSTLSKTMYAAKDLIYGQRLQKLQARFVKFFCNSEYTERFMSLFCRWKLSHLLSFSYLANQWQSKPQLAQHNEFHVEAMCSPSGKYIMHLGLVHTQSQQKAVNWPQQQNWALQVLSRCVVGAQLDTGQPVMRCIIKGRICNPKFLILLKKHKYISNSQGGAGGAIYYENAPGHF